MSKKKKSRFAGKVAADNKRQATAGNSYGYLKIPKGMSVWAPEPGKRSSFDVIPYTVTNPKHPDRNAEEGIAVPGEIWYKRPFRVHRNVGVGKEAVVCLTSFGKKCPICESTLRNLYCVIPIGSKEHEAKPHILDISQFLFQEKLNEEIAENADYETYMDIEEGLTLNVRWLSSTMGGGKPFAEAGRIDFDARKKQYTEDILDEVPDLDSLLTELSYKEMETKFMEMEGEAELTEEEEDDDQDDAPPARKRKVVVEDDEPPVRKRKPPVEEDDDEEDAPPPKPKKKPVVAEEEDDDDDQDDQDDEPAPPVRKRKPAPAPEPVKKKKPVVVEEDDEDDDDQDDPLICVACQGTGRNSKGKRCAVCGGTGIKPDVDEDDDPDEDED
jgi:hypothetical protein